MYVYYIYKHILYYILYYLKFIDKNISAIEKAFIDLSIVTVMMNDFSCIFVLILIGWPLKFSSEVELWELFSERLYY